MKTFSVSLLLSGLLLVGCSGQKEAPPAKDNPAPLSSNILKVSLADLWGTYSDNPIKADGLWKGKTIQITGTVDVIKPDSIGFLKNPGGGNVSPSRYNSMSEREKRFFNGQANPGIVCVIDPAHKKDFETAEKDKPITVIGRCEGRYDDPDVFEGYAIKLTLCRVAAGEKQAKASAAPEKKPEDEKKLLPDPEVPPN